MRLRPLFDTAGEAGFAAIDMGNTEGLIALESNAGIEFRSLLLFNLPQGPLGPTASGLLTSLLWTVRLPTPR